MTRRKRLRFAGGIQFHAAFKCSVAFIVVILVRVVAGIQKHEARRSFGSPGFAGNSSLTMTEGYSVVLPEGDQSQATSRSMPCAKQDPMDGRLVG